jgi:hypothetical protein
MSRSGVKVVIFVRMKLRHAHDIRRYVRSCEDSVVLPQHASAKAFGHNPMRHGRKQVAERSGVAKRGVTADTAAFFLGAYKPEVLGVG